MKILWTPAGAEIPNLGSRALVDVTDGDTPNIRMPIRMLSVDTPEVTARSTGKAKEIDERFMELADWIENGHAPVKQSFADYILPKLKTGQAGSLQFDQGKQASAWFKKRTEDRLKRPGSGKQRALFMRTADSPFDKYHRLLAYVAPSYSKKERETMTRKERSTFNLDLIESGWAAPFIIFPNIPGELDLPLYLKASDDAINNSSGQYADTDSLPAFEYRACEKLYSITKSLIEGEKLHPRDRLAWRTRYAADMRDRTIYGPENYMSVPMQYLIWIWPQDVQKAIGALNLEPSNEFFT